MSKPVFWEEQEKCHQFVICWISLENGHGCLSHYENTPIQIYWTFHHQKTESFQIKFYFFFFHISAQNIDCGYSLEPPRWGGSNDYPQSMFLSRNKKNNVYPCKPQFYYIKLQNYIGMFSWCLHAQYRVVKSKKVTRSSGGGCGESV